jgi:hypothetical protein
LLDIKCLYSVTLIGKLLRVAYLFVNNDKPKA